MYMHPFTGPWYTHLKSLQHCLLISYIPINKKKKNGLPQITKSVRHWGSKMLLIGTSLLSQPNTACPLTLHSTAALHYLSHHAHVMPPSWSQNQYVLPGTKEVPDKICRMITWFFFFFPGTPKPQLSHLVQPGTPWHLGIQLHSPAPGGAHPCAPGSWQHPV